MSFNQSVYYMEKRGNLEGFSDREKIEFVNCCNNNYFFYEPIKDLIINPITSEKYLPKTLQNIFNISNSELNEKLNYKSPTKASVEISIKKLKNLKDRGSILYFIIRKLKYVGVIIGFLISYLINFELGLAIGLYLIYFDYNTFDNVNDLIDHHLSELGTALIWKQKREIYFFGSLLILLGSLTSLYFLTNSMWLVICVFIAHKFIFVNPIVQFITSSGYMGNELVWELEDVFKKQNK
jgi:hypothetical protein